MKCKNMTPEEKFDCELFYRNYCHYIVWILFFLIVPVEFLAGLMPAEVVAALAMTFASILMAVILTPLLFEGGGDRMKRRIRLAVFFPIDKKRYIRSKIYFAGKYALICTGMIIAAQILAIPLLGFDNLILNPLCFLAGCAVSGGIFLAFGTVGK